MQNNNHNQDGKAQYFASPSQIFRKKTLKDSVGKKPDGNTSLPIPKGDSPYALAKRAEYIQKDLDKAKAYYQEAIDSGDRVESAVKDLASLLHQEASTTQACSLLQKYRHIFSDVSKADNLLENLKRQVMPTGNCQNKYLKLYPLTVADTAVSVKSLFRNPERILDIEIRKDIAANLKYAIIRFPSHSAARKTLEGFHKWNRFKVEWVNVEGEVIGEANHSRHKRHFHGKKNCNPYNIWELPIDEFQPQVTRIQSADESTAQHLLGNDLLYQL